MKTWVITDTHFYHSKLIEYCGRPTNFTEQIINNWKIIDRQDVVFHLGDVGFYKKNPTFQNLLRNLPGLKVLIRGNHDRFPIQWYMDAGFLAVMESTIINVCHHQVKREKAVNHYYRVLLSHIPQPIPDDSVDFNLHGHFHNNPPSRWEEKLVDVLTPKHRLLSIEELQYKPVLLGWAIHHNKFINSYERAISKF